MVATKDLIMLTIFMISLVVLFQTTNHIMALTTTMFIVIIYFIKDIRLKNSLKRELKNQIDIFDTMFNSSSDIIIFQDAEMNVVACNDFLSKIFGIPKKQILKKNINNIIQNNIKDAALSKQMWNTVRRNTEKAIKTRKSVSYMEHFFTPSGEIRFFNILISPIKDNSNFSILVARDFTNEYNASKMAKEKGEQLQSILENMPICAYLKSPNGTYIAGSSTFEKIVSLQRNENMQLVLPEVMDKDYVKFVEEEEAKIVKSKKAICVERKLPFPSKTFWARVQKVPILDENGEVKYIVVMYENIELEKEIEKQKEYFVETLIHDLKVPTLAQLRGLELLEHGTIGSVNLEQKELLLQIKDSCRYILDMISMVLNTYRLESGQASLEFETFDMAELLLNCFEEMSAVAKEKNLTFVYASQKVDARVDGDKEKIKKVIINLLSHAVIYSNRNESIVTTISIENDTLSFNITSTGITLSERECSTMFERITEKTSKYTTVGHGIGLYYCKKIIDLHNGKIFASTNGKSSNSVTFMLPLQQQKISSISVLPQFMTMHKF